MENKSYMKGFVPYAIAAAVLSLCGGHIYCLEC